MAENNELGIKITANNLAEASFSQLKADLKQLQELQKTMGEVSAASLQKEIDGIQKTLSARSEQVSSIKKVTEAVKEQQAAVQTLHRTLQENIDSSFGVGFERQIKSASDSARVLATSLSAAAEADARFRTEEQATAAAALKAAEAIKLQGAAVRTLTGEQFFGVVQRKAGIGQPTLSAEESAKVFEQTLGAAGQGITSTAIRGTIDTLHGINREMLSAKDSAKVFQAELGELGAAVQTTAASGFSKMVADLAGVKANFISAAESAAVFQRELGLAGTGITSVGTQSTINTLMGINREMLSARESAQVFSRELGEIGSGVTTIASSGFHQMVAELAGVKQNYLSAAASAEVFAQVASQKQQYMPQQHIVAEGQMQRARIEAAAENIEHNMRMSQLRAEAELENTNRDLAIAKIRQEAEAENTEHDARMSQLRAEAEYENRNRDLAYAKMRAEADFENAQRSRQPASSRDPLSKAMGHGMALMDEGMRDQRGQMVATLGAMARDAGLGVVGLSTSMAVLGGVMAGIGLEHHVETMGKWATETRAAAEAAGMSVSQYSGLQAILMHMGMEASEADASLRHFTQTLSEAQGNPSGKQAEALKNIGVTSQMLKANTEGAVGALKLLASAFDETETSANKAANFEEIFGRGWERIIPLLKNGGAGIDELSQKMKEMGLTLDEDGSAKMEKAGESVRSLGEVIRGGAIKAMQDWAPEIEAINKLLMTLAEVAFKAVGAIGKVFTMAGEGIKMAHEELFKLFPDSAQQAMKALTTGIGGGSIGTQTPLQSAQTSLGPMTKRTVAPLTDPISILEQLHSKATAAGAAASGGGSGLAENQAELKSLKESLATATLTEKEKEKLQDEINQKTMTVNNEMASGGKRDAHQSYENFAAAEKLKIAEAQGNSQQIIAIYDEWDNAAQNIYKQNANVYKQIEREKVQAVNKARLQELEESTKSTEQQNRLTKTNAELQQVTSPNYKPDKELGPGQLQQQAAQLKAEAAGVEAKLQAQVSNFQEVAATAEAGSATQKKAQDDIMNITLQSKSEEVALYKQAAAATAEAAKKMSQAFVSFFDSLGGEFQSFQNSLIKALLAPQQEVIHAGLTTMRKSMQGTEITQAIGHLFLSAIDNVAGKVEDALGHMLANALSGGASGSMGELLGNWLSKAFSSIAPGLFSGATSATGAAALTAAGATLTTAGGTLTAGSTLLVTAATSLQAAASAQTIHSLIPGFASGGIVPSAAGGMIVGGMGGTLAVLHPKEMVLPAQLSQGVQQMISRGQSAGPNQNASLNYSPTINTGSRSRSGTGMSRSEFSQMLSSHSGALLGEARNMIRNGWRPA